MATENPKRERANDRLNEDRRTQRAVLAFLIDQLPARLKRSELPFALDAKDLAEKDAIAKAIRELTSVGLLSTEGDYLSPSRAVVYLEWLEGE